MKKNIVLTIGLVLSVLHLDAAIRLPVFFSSNMVLQRNAAIPVWGWAKPNEKVTVKFKQQQQSSMTDKSGKWMIYLSPEPAGGPFELIIQGDDTITFTNVLVGEVWLCSGQSNMEWTVGQSFQAAKEMAAANYPYIRHIKIAKDINTIPVTDVLPATWKVCSPATVSSFTAVGYFFARRMYDSLHIPVGLINSSWGGTNIETWISREGFESSNEFAKMIAKLPKLDIDSLTKLKMISGEKRIAALQGTSIKDIQPVLFKDRDFNDARWPEMNVPQLWEQQSLGELDGVVWLRKTFFLSAEELHGPATIRLAKIDDDDITYVNGIQVGRTNQWDVIRSYQIPTGTLKPGKNVIAIRVVDNGGGGGIYGDKKDLSLTVGNSIVLLHGRWKYQVESMKNNINENSLPSLCYNAMINPLIPFALQGVLWYQGEANIGRAYQYRTSFPLLIQDWRKKWNNPGLYFYYVQLATYTSDGNSNDGCNWAELREAQALTLQVPNTGMCVTTDIGNPSDIHPINKQDVGSRLAAIALKNIHKKNLVCDGPAYKSMKIDGNKVILSFSDTGAGLYTTDKDGNVRGFEIASRKDSIFYPAKAFISGNQVIVSSEMVANPAVVNFGWVGDTSECNLFNREGLPAIPFRTAEWKTISQNVKYTIDLEN